MQEIARDVYEAMQQTRPAEARVWQEWIENGEARIVDPELAPAPACTRCGATVRVEARFCQQCGLPLTTDALLRGVCDVIAKDAGAAADDPRVMQAAPGVQAVEWEEVPTGIPTARISRATWQADREWKQKNPEGRLKAIWYPKAGRLGLVRLSGLAQTLEHQGEEVDYPTFEDQPTTWTVHSDPGPTVTLQLEWVG